jgi:mannose-6-phosphate isomerase-like protein (cupin superfamily)
MIHKTVFCILAVQFLVACQVNGGAKLVFPDKSYQDIEWTEDELARDISIRNLYRGTDASAHLIRLQGNEFPHYHDHHDLNVTLLSGKSIIHFHDHEVSLLPGDVIFIPKGKFHWAENVDPLASVVFAVFSPAFDGQDRRKAE